MPSAAFSDMAESLLTGLVCGSIVLVELNIVSGIWTHLEVKA